MTDLFQKSPFLDDIGHCFHLDAFGLVDVLEGIKLPSLLVLYYSNLLKTTRP
jgi:hypothetical protein